MSELTRLEAELQIVNARIEAARLNVADLMIELRNATNEVRRISAVLDKIHTRIDEMTP